MNLTRISLGLLILTATILAGCSKDEDGNNGNDNYDGYITFYTKTTGTGCGTITISLNGNQIGTLTGTTASDPVCQAANAPGILTVGVDIGAHNYAASDECTNIWTGTIIINKGDCKTKELSR